jgi:hypothetical protein
MSIDFLDRLEADLREAAERRGRPSPRRRRPRPGPAFKAVAVAAVLALLVVGGARLANHDGSERPAATPTPTPTSTPEPVIALFTNGPVKTAVATTGDASSLEFLVQRLADGPELRFIAPPNGRPALADPSLGAVVLYRGDDAKDFATFVARGALIERVRPLTKADEQKINFDVSRARLVIVFSDDDAPSSESQHCTSAGSVTGGVLSFCRVTRDGVSLTGLYVNGQRLAVPRMTERGHWTWAAASPDGRTILAQWSGECEVPQAFLLDADGGSPRAVAPMDAQSEALGWTTDGRAIVFLAQQPACGTEFRPGTYLVSADGTERTRVLPATGDTPPIAPSVQPRTVEEVSQAAG